MLRFRVLLAFALTAALGIMGCAQMPSDQATQEASQSSLPSVPAEWTAIERRIKGEPVAWIAQFQDARLSRLVEEALLNNPDLRASRSRIARARGLAQGAGSLLAPQVSVGPTAEGLGELKAGALTKTRLAANFEWEIDLWSRLSVRREASQKSSEAIEADYRGARNLLAAAVAQQYFLSIEAAKQRTIAEALVQAATEMHRIVNVQYERGFASSGDAALSQSDLASAEERLTAVSAGHRDALRALETVLGRYPAASADFGSTLPAVPAQPPTGLPSEILERRPDIVAAERRVAAALGALSVAKTARLPSLSLVGELGEPSQQLAGVLSPDEIAWQAVASLLSPIFTGGRIEAAKTIASADVELAVAGYASTALSAFSEVESALDQSVTLKSRVASLRIATQSANRALSIARKAYNAGEIGLLDVLILQQRFFQNESQLTAVKRAQLDQYLRLNLAVGGDWDGAKVTDPLLPST